MNEVVSYLPPRLLIHRRTLTPTCTYSQSDLLIGARSNEGEIEETNNKAFPIYYSLCQWAWLFPFVSVCTILRRILSFFLCGALLTNSGLLVPLYFLKRQHLHTHQLLITRYWPNKKKNSTCPFLMNKL